MPKTTKPQNEQPENNDDELTDEDEQRGFILVELHPRALNIPGRKDASRIFHEFEDRHPNNGEALVVRGRVVKVYPTARVRDALARNLLRESKKPETPTQNMDELVDAQAQAAKFNTAAESASKTNELEQQNKDLLAQLAALQAMQNQPATPAQQAPASDGLTTSDDLASKKTAK